MVVSGKLGVGPLIMDATWARPFFLRVSSLSFPQTTRTSASSRFFFFLFWGGGRRKAQLAGRDARRAAREVTTADQKTVEEVPGNRVQPNSQQPTAKCNTATTRFPDSSAAQQLSSRTAQQLNRPPSGFRFLFSKSPTAATAITTTAGLCFRENV